MLPNTSADLYQTLRHPERSDLWCAVRVDEPVPEFLDGTWLVGPVVSPHTEEVDGFDAAAAVFACAIQGFYAYNAKRPATFALACSQIAGQAA